ncbi:polysaccharide deacetylase family protein [Peribacillus asahii]|uniref:Polysaccharide deacetylase n=1 Tax=Peribacillus asahii TaxID=228899 RepID=A0A3Q9RKI2_9BACI|nr:polysaccharide deacetylase family protein [Peribacillus asahii]AZV41211.1 polysaccharide deacetylase [Peribacillus asahii]USK85583.1 polysaccharide deacetylase family protein [Peribacillus asahii]
MSVCNEKRVELLAIQKESGQFFLHIRLLLDQEIELVWEVDETTANSLQARAKFETGAKYYLSFYHSWDALKKKKVSCITRTYLGKSNKKFFSCSKEYSQNLNLLKPIQQIKQLHALPFLSSPHSLKQDKEITSKQKTTYIPFLSPKLAWMAVFIMSLFAFLGLNETKPVKAEALNNKIVVTAASVIPEEKESIQQPAIKLKKSMNYTVPRGYVALTFDDGPSKYSKKIVNILKKYKVGGTFFYIGTNVKNRPEDVKYTKRNGFSIGSHSMNHPKFTSLSYQKQEKELTQANTIIEKITKEPVTLFRPPYGAKNLNTSKLTKKYSQKMVIWSIDTRDWESRNAKKILTVVKSSKTSGSIILLHESSAVVEALPDIIKHLQKEDLKIVNLQ